MLNRNPLDIDQILLTCSARYLSQVLLRQHSIIIMSKILINDFNDFSDSSTRDVEFLVDVFFDSKLI